MKCLCGEYLETCTGKFGLYFKYVRCGNINKKKVFEINPLRECQPQNQPQKPQSSFETKITSKPENENKPAQKEKKEIIIRSDDPFYFS